MTRPATPCTDLVRAVRGAARLVIEADDPSRKRAQLIDAFIATLDAEIRAIKGRDIAADARRAGL